MIYHYLYLDRGDFCTYSIEISYLFVTTKYNLLEDVIFCDESNIESMTQVAAFMAHRKLCKKITRVKIMITIANKKLIYNLFDFAELQVFKCYGK